MASGPAKSQKGEWRQASPRSCEGRPRPGARFRPPLAARRRDGGFFSLLQKNVLDTQRWNTQEELRLAIATRTKTKYNRRRGQRRLGKLTPVEFETIYEAANAA